MVRKLSLGNLMRQGIKSGFTNLSGSRTNLGPLDFYLDNNIFNFDGKTSKNLLCNVGDFEFLDGLMGGKWDVQLGKDCDSFFKFVTEVEVRKTADFCIILIVKFSQSMFIFSEECYREDCRRYVTERKLATQSQYMGTALFNKHGKW
jgi:hypothetical protein